MERQTYTYDEAFRASLEYLMVMNWPLVYG